VWYCVSMIHFLIVAGVIALALGCVEAWLKEQGVELW